MSGRLMAVHDEASAFLRGERRATQFLTVLKALASDGDELFRLVRVTPADELRGVCRALQKHLERQPGAVK